MLFNSLTFLVFLGAFFVLWPYANRSPRRRLVYITLASFLFYGWWDWRYLLLLVGSTAADFGCAIAIENRPRRRTLFLWLALGVNLATLGIFKYLDFAIENLNAVLGWIGFDARFALQHVVLPVGISFYTFQAMSYVIDVYRGDIRATRDPWHFYAFLTFFPQLVAGPIVRAADLLPQLLEERRATEAMRWAGLREIACGFFKKVVIADHLAPVVNAAFAAEASGGTGVYWWTVLALFSAQVYCDFSGYSDIARGLARWMGYEFPVNFNHPYLAGSVREFWSRWHISLTTWFRDYIYVPMGGSRVSQGRVHFNLWTIMLVSGLWHGAAWTFVAFAVLHAAYMSLERLTGWPERLARVPGGRHLAPLLVFLLVSLTWAFFRASSIDQAMRIVSSLFDFGGRGLAPVRIEGVHYALAGIVLARHLWFHLGLEKAIPHDSPARNTLQPVAVVLLLCASVVFRGPGSAFLYFQF